jgi:hypothetical protein
MSLINLETIQHRLAGDVTFIECRLPRHGRHGSNVTIFPSRKNSAPLMCESLLEAAFCLELEHRSDVLCYQIHPYTLVFEAANIRYTPDFQVTFANGDQHLVEVKNDQSLKCQKIRARLARITELLAEQGCLLERLSMHQFYNVTRISNLEYLYHLAFGNSGSEDKAIRHYLAQQPKAITLHELMQTPFDPTDIAHALFYKTIHCNITKPITGHTMVWFK